MYDKCVVWLLVFFFKQKTAYEMRISDWSSDVCSSDLSTRFGSAVNGSRKAVSGSGSSTMSDWWMPRQPEMLEPSNILPSSNSVGSMIDLGKVTWCCTPRMSEKRRSTNSTRWSAMSFSMFSMDMAGWPAGRSSALLQGACQGCLGCKRLISFNKRWRPPVVSHQIDAFFLCVAPFWCDNWKRLAPDRKSTRLNSSH